MVDKPYDPGDDIIMMVKRLDCCVCGEPILGLTPYDRPHWFMVEAIVGKDGKPMKLYCHQDPCKEIVNDVGREKDWRKLPNGPLRRKFEEAIKNRKG